VIAGGGGYLAASTASIFSLMVSAVNGFTT
jgi:hypothetical protein